MFLKKENWMNLNAKITKMKKEKSVVCYFRIAIDIWDRLTAKARQERRTAAKQAEIYIERGLNDETLQK